MTVAARVHFLDISDKIHLVFTAIVEPADEGRQHTGSFDPLVAAYTAAACSCEKHSVMLTRISCWTDLSAARKPSCVQGYLM
jgi:hypothetical protein